MGPDRHNGILMSLLLLVAETISKNKDFTDLLNITKDVYVLYIFAGLKTNIFTSMSDAM